MKITGKNREIKDFAEWEDAFGGNNWKDGYSACSLAKYFTEPNLENSKGLSFIREFMGRFGYNNVEFLSADIEHQSPFDEIKRGKKRTHDLFVLTESSDKRIPICIEAKVDEPFGRSISSAYNEALKYKANHGESNQPGRIEKLCKDLFGITITENEKFEKNEELGKLKYQLFYYLAGSFKDAKCREHTDIVFMPVLVFHEYKKRDSNLKAYKIFMELLPLKDKETIISDDGTMTIYKGEIEGVTIISCYATIGRI
jgi:hypothetical protein